MTNQESVILNVHPSVRLKNHMGSVSTSRFTGLEGHVAVVLIIYVVIVNFIQVPNLSGYPLACECRLMGI